MFMQHVNKLGKGMMINNVPQDQAQSGYICDLRGLSAHEQQKQL